MQFLIMSLHMYFPVQVTLSSIICLLFKFSTTFRLMWVTEAKVVTKDTHTHTHTHSYSHTNRKTSLAFSVLLCSVKETRNKVKVSGLL